MVVEPIRTLIVDDSRIFRGVLEQALAKIPDVAVIGSVFSGDKAIEFLKKTPADLVTLDVDMPGMDGLTTLRTIRDLNRSRPGGPAIETVLVSALTKQGARCTVEGLQAGALDFILKPSGDSESENFQSLVRALEEKLEALRCRRRGLRKSADSNAVSNTLPPVSSRPPIQWNSTSGLLKGNTTTETARRERKIFGALAIGISTGGPETLAQMMPQIAGRVDQPIFIVQHNLDGLSAYMAESLTRRVGWEVKEVNEETLVQPRGIYLARSGKHMVIRNAGTKILLGLSDAPPECHSKPSVDVFLRSAAAVYGSGLLAIIMTGMMNDGANGVRAVKRAGGIVIAQDEASSVVWGMPRAAIETGSVDLVLSLNEMTPNILSLLGGR